jgi:hypothetical protein
MAVVYKDGVFRNVKNGNEEVLEVFNLASAQAAGSTATLISATSGKRIRIVSAYYASGGIASCNVKWGPNIIGNASMIANIPMLLGFNEAGWYESATSEAIIVDTFTNAISYNYRYIVYEP